MSLQEKFQITVPAAESAGLDWVDFKSARILRGPAGESNRLPEVDLDANTGTPANFVKGFGGDTDATNHVTGALQKGYTRHDLKSTDDQYTGEHMDIFYYTVKDVDGKEGFCERANYMDRL